MARARTTQTTVIRLRASRRDRITSANNGAINITTNGTGDVVVNGGSLKIVASRTPCGSARSRRYRRPYPVVFRRRLVDADGTPGAPTVSNHGNALGRRLQRRAARAHREGLIMALNAGNAACSTGLFQTLYDYWTGDATSSFSGSMSADQTAMVKSLCYAVARASSTDAQTNAVVNVTADTDDFGTGIPPAPVVLGGSIT